MTSPGGNEIEFITRLIPAGDEAAVLAEIGKRGVEGLISALRSSPIQLPDIDASHLETQLTQIANALRTRMESAAQQSGAAMESAAQKSVTAWREVLAAVRTAGAPDLTLGTRSEWEQQAQLQRMLQQRRALESYAPNLQASAEATYAPNLEASMQKEAVEATALRTEIEGLSTAERNLAVAKARVDAAFASGTLEQQIGAVNRLQSAERALTQEEERQARARTANQGFMANAWSGFTTGRGLFHHAEGEDGANAFQRTGGQSGEFLGAIARYQAAYALIYGVTRGFSALLQAQAAADDAMVEFGHATDLSGDALDRYSSHLQQVVAVAGGSAAQAIQTATRGIFAFGGDPQLTALQGAADPNERLIQARRQQIGDVSAQTAAQAKLLTGAQDITVVQQQLIATTTGFNLTADQQTRVLDAAANAARNYGAGIDQILQGLPGVSEQARQAGLSVEETANLMSVAIARSGQTGTGVSSLLNRAIGAINERAGTRELLQSMGVDAGQSQTSGQVLESLASHWKNLSAAQQTAAETALGGHEVARALLPILQEGDRLTEANAKSYNNAGYATELYYQRLNTLAGVLRQIVGVAQAFAFDLVRTGALDPFGALLKTLVPILQTVDDLLRLYDLIPGSIRPWLTGLAEVLLLLNLIGRAMVRNAAAQAAVTAETEAEAGAETVNAAVRGGGLLGRVPVVGRFFRGGTVAAEGEQAAAKIGLGTSLSEGAAAAASALAGPAGLALAAVGAAVAIDGVIRASQHEAQVRRQIADAETTLGTATTSESLRAAASALGNAAEEQKHAQGGIWGSILSAFTETPSRYSPDTLQAQSRWATDMANAIDAQQATLNANRVGPGEFFGNVNNDWAQSMTAGIQSMQRAGLPATTQLRLLTEAIGGVAAVAPDAGSALDANIRRLLQDQASGPKAYGTKELESGIDTAVSGAIIAAANNLKTADINIPALNKRLLEQARATPALERTYAQTDALSGAQQGFNYSPKELQEQARATLSWIGDIRHVGAVVNTEMVRMGLTADTVVTPQQMNELSAHVISALGLDRVLSGQARAQLAAAIQAGAIQALDAQATAPLPFLKDQQSLNDFVLGKFDTTGKQTQAAQLDPYLQYLRQQVDPRQMDSGVNELAGEVTFLQALVASARAQGLGGEALSVIVTRLHTAEHEYVQAEVGRIEKLRSAAVARDASNPAKVLADNVHFVEQEARIAVSQGDITALNAILNTADRATLNTVKSYFQNAYTVAKAAYDHAEAVYRAALAALEAFPGDVRRLAPEDRPTPPAPPDRTNLNRTKSALDALNAAIAGGVTPTDAKDAAAKDDPTAARILASARSGDSVDEAHKQLDAARYTLAHAKRNTTEYWNDYKAVNDAKRGLADAEAAQAAAQASEHVRPGDPLSAATAALNAAKINLDEQIRGTAAWWQAWQQYHDAQYQLSVTALEHAHQVRLTHLDQTDPVATAREDLRVANDRLNADRRNGTGDITADLVQQQSANARLQAAIFDQRFHDVQVAHDLGQMSDAAYLRYLESQRDRLQAIHQKTRQQIEELQQIDQAIKAAADQMQGQWNLGDIRIPTAYEARRYIQTTTMGVPYNSTNVTNNNQFDFSGMDKSEVIALLSEVLGADTTSRTTTTTRKV